MKRFILAATALLTVAGSIAAPGAVAQPRGYEQSYNQRGYNERHDDRWNDRNDHRYDRDHKWKRGDRLGDYRRSYREIDYRSNHLRTPPRGHHYVRDNNTGEIILAAIATGIIASIILN